MTSVHLSVKLLNENARLPSKGSEFAAGYDLYSADNVVIPRGERRVVKTGISIAIPYGSYARIAPRSGLSVKNGIHIGAGIVDFDFKPLK